MTEVKTGQVWKHVKTEGLYEVVYNGANIQCSTMEEFEEELGNKSWVIYKNSLGRHFVRLETEFCDGRFALVREVPIKVEKFTGDYGGPGRLVATFFPDADDIDKVRHVVAFKIEGGFGEFYHIMTPKQIAEKE